MGPFFTYNDGDSTSRHHDGWYGEYFYFVEYIAPWVTRGCMDNDGNLAGVFIFPRYAGLNFDTVSFRLVLAP